MERRVFIRHIHSARANGRAGHKLCVPGLRNWAKHHNIDVRDFYKNGILISDLSQFKDDTAIQAVIAEAEKEWALQVV